MTPRQNKASKPQKKLPNVFIGCQRIITGKSRLAAVIIFTFILLAGRILLVGGTVAAGPANNPEQLEAFLDGVIYGQMDENNIIGVTLAVVQNGEVTLAKGYGYANLETRTPVDAEKTLFRPGSTSKLFTWTAIMQLVEQGKLDLHVDINDYLDFEIKNQLNGTSRPALPGPITLANLLTHTPGFEDSGENLFVLAADKMLTLEEYLKQHIPVRVFPPGQVLAYSNYGTALAGYIVELVSGMPFAEYIEQNVFEPLEMKNSTFRQPLPNHLAPQMAQAYKFHNGEYHKGSFEYIAALPAGSMSSTAADLARFMIAHLQNGLYKEVRILEEDTAREMHRQQFTHHPLQDGMAYGFIEQTINGRRIINHGGNTFLFGTGCYLLLEENVGLFVSYSGGTGMEREALLKAFMDRYYPSPLATDAHPVPPAGSVERAAAFRGVYHPNRANFSSMEKLFNYFQAIRVNVNKDGYLSANVFSTPIQFVEIEPGVYRNRHTEGTQLVNTIVFVTDEKGRQMMCAEGPVLTATKAPWYGRGTLAALLVVSGLLFFLTAVAGWIVASLRRVFRREQILASKPALAARLTAAMWGLLFSVLLFGLVGAFTDLDPAFGVPTFFMEGSDALMSLLIFPYLLATTTVAMLVFTALAWQKKYWTISGRIHYTVLTLSSSGVLWLMLYNNLL